MIWHNISVCDGRSTKHSGDQLIRMAPPPQKKRLKFPSLGPFFATLGKRAPPEAAHPPGVGVGGAGILKLDQEFSEHRPSSPQAHTALQ